MVNQLLDVFAADAFSMTSLTAAINGMPYVPSKAASLGVFREKSATTRTINVESRDGTLALIPNTPIGAPPNQSASAKRVVRAFTIPHLPLEDTVMASEIQGVRAFGGSQLQGVQEVVNTKMATMKAKHDATLEYGRLGAIKGVILDSDGSTTIYNLFTEFGISQTSVDFVLATSTTNVKGKAHEVIRAIETELGQLTYQRIHCYCGKDWFDAFVNHTAVKAAYELWQDGTFLRTTQRGGFEFAGITFEEYRGSVGGVAFIADAEAYAFPVGVPDLFISHFAPGDFIESANTPGLPLYARQHVMEYNRGVKVLTESNPLSINTRPKTSVKLTTS